MADLVQAIRSVVIALQAKKGGQLYQPARIRAVLEDGSFLVSVNGKAPIRHVAEGDSAPFWAGDRVWVSETYALQTWTAGDGLQGGVATGGHLIHGKKVDG